MKFGGFWVVEADGNVILQSCILDDTELDPATNWTEAWQNQDPDGSAKGFVGVERAVAHAAALLARSRPLGISADEVETIQRTPSMFQNGQCVVGTLDDLRNFCMVINSLPEICVRDPAVSPKLVSAEEGEIPFT